MEMEREAARTFLKKHLIDDLFFGDPGAILKDESDLWALGLDSLGVTRLLVALERDLGLRVPDEAVRREHFRSIAALLAMLEESGRSGRG
jgi:acyl carrier protein